MGPPLEWQPREPRWTQYATAATAGDKRGHSYRQGTPEPRMPTRQRSSLDFPPNGAYAGMAAALGWRQRFGPEAPMPDDRSTTSDLRLALDLHRRGKPADAPVHLLLAAPAVVGKLAAFDAADAIAIREQRAYRRVGRFSLWCMLIGALVGALALLPLGAWIDGLPRKVIAALQALALVLTVLAMIWISWRRSLGRWMRARAEAEALRADVFRAIMQAGVAGAKLPAALACFRDAHLDWQLGYYKKRGGQHRQATGSATPYKMLAYLLTGVSILLALIGLASFAAEVGFSIPYVSNWLRWLVIPESGRWQLGLGTMASSLLAFASARSFMDQDDRNASCYELAAAELDRLLASDWEKAAAAAGEGKAGDVIAFCERVQSVLSAEHLAWIFARPRDAVIVAPPE